MVEEQKRAGWTFWCVFAVTLPLLFVLSIAPSCWLSSRFGGAGLVTNVYRPVTWAAELTGSHFVMEGLQRYSHLWTSETDGFWFWTFDAEDPGNAYWTCLDNLPTAAWE